MIKKISCVIMICLTILIFGCGRPLKDGMPITETKKDYNDDSISYMPVIIGLSDKKIENEINKTIEKTLNENYRKIKGDQTEGKTEEGFTAYLTGSLMSIFQEGYFYNETAAHGQSYLVVLHINLLSGQFYKFEDLFLKDADYLSKLKELAAECLINDLGENWLSQGIPVENANFDFFDGNLILIFDPYQVAANSQGFVDVAIPIIKLKGYIDEQSTFFKALNTNLDNTPAAGAYGE